MTTELRHEIEACRYSFWVDGEEVGLTDYREHDGIIEIVHTEIDPVRRGHGFGGEMVRGVLDDIRSTSAARVVPACPFVSRFMLRNPSYVDLLRERGEPAEV
jgi:predicted GNAT family acetyltransferase